MATLTAPVVGGKGTVELAADVFGHETHRQLLYEAVRAEMLARRQGTSADQDPRPGGRRRGQAVAPEGHRPRARGHDPLAALDGRRRRLRPAPARLRRQDEPQGRAARQADRALAARGARQPRRVRRRGVRVAEDQGRRARWSGAWGQQLPLVVLVGEEESAAALSFRNLERVIVAWAEDITVVELLWARSLLVSQAALAELQGGADVTSVTTDPRHVILEPVVSEKAYNLIQFDKYTFKVAPEGAQDAGPPGDRAALRRPRRRRQDRQRAGQAQAPRSDGRASARATRRPSSSCAQAIRSSSSRGRANGCPSVQAHLAGSSLHDDLGLRRGHDATSRRRACSPRSSATAAATTPAASRRATRAAATSAATASSTSSGARTAFRPRSPRSSTTPTARRASRCCTTSTAHKAYILAPARLAVGATRAVRRGRRHQGRQLPAAVVDPDRHDRARRRAAARPGRAHGALGRRERAAGRHARRAARCCACPPASCAASPRRAARRSARSRNATHQNQSERQGRALALAGQAPVGARHGDEPRRPPARRRRGQEQGQSPGHAVGQDHARPADP